MAGDATSGSTGSSGEVHHDPLKKVCTDTDSGTLAHLLEPALVAACDGRLSNIQWFRSAWQAGGASTGFARYRLAPGQEAEVVVKLPVGPAEFRWTRALGSVHEHGPADRDGAIPCDCTPRVFAAGIELGGYDLAWLVIEKLDGKPLSARIDQKAVEDFLTAAVDWYAAAGQARPPADAPAPPRRDFAALIAKGREVIHHHGIPEEQRWNTAIKAVQKALPSLLGRWDARPISTWCHGDLHLGNAMRRRPPRPDVQGPCVLIDLALVHPGHWIEDAVYLERLYWAKPEILCGVKPVSFVSRLIRERRMGSGEDVTLLAHTRRVLMAACVPAFMLHEGHPKYVHAALEVLERTLPLIPH
jgi:uncharacterized protein YfiM (DUF2279 family)